MAELEKQGGKGPAPVYKFISENVDRGDFKRESFAEGAMTFESLCSLQCRVWKAIKEIELF